MSQTSKICSTNRLMWDQEVSQPLHSESDETENVWNNNAASHRNWLKSSQTVNHEAKFHCFKRKKSRPKGLQLHAHPAVRGLQEPSPVSKHATLNEAPAAEAHSFKNEHISYSFHKSHQIINSTWRSTTSRSATT